MFEMLSNSTEETMMLGQKLGQILISGSVVLLQGDLGAGKTHFSKGVAVGLGVTEHVTSPTFTLINEYHGRLPLYHMDFYRLGEPDEALDLGLEEYFYSDGTSLVEWPDKIDGYLPGEHIEVNIDALDENQRQIKITAKGSKYDSLIEELKNIVHSGN